MNLSISIKERFFQGRPFITEKARGSNALKRDYTSDDQLYDFLDDARCELEKAVLTFNELTDEKAIDYASYNLLAASKIFLSFKTCKRKKLSLWSPQREFIVRNVNHDLRRYSSVCPPWPSKVTSSAYSRSPAYRKPVSLVTFIPAGFISLAMYIAVASPLCWDWWLL